MNKDRSNLSPRRLILPWPLWLRSGQLPCFFLVRFLCPVMKFRGATPTYATNERGLLKRSILPTTVMTRALIWVPTPRTLWSRRPRSSDITNSCRVWFNCPICRSRDLTASSKNNMALATGLVIKSTLASMLSRSFFKFLCPAAQGIPHCWAKALKLTMLFERCDISCCRTACTVWMRISVMLLWRMGVSSASETASLANAIASLRSVFCPDKWVLIHIETVQPLMTLISWPRFSSWRHNKL